MIRSTPEETAQLLAVMLNRSKRPRARIGTKTIRVLAKRRRLRLAFIDLVSQHLDDLGWVLIEADRGGYAAIRTSVLDGAPSVTARRLLGDDLEALKNQEQRKQLFMRFRFELEGLEDSG